MVATSLWWLSVHGSYQSMVAADRRTSGLSSQAITLAYIPKLHQAGSAGPCWAGPGRARLGRAACRTVTGPAVSCHAVPSWVLACLTMPCSAVPGLIRPCHSVFCRAATHHNALYHAVSWPARPAQAISCRAVPCRARPCQAVSAPAAPPRAAPFSLTCRPCRAGSGPAGPSRSESDRAGPC